MTTCDNDHDPISFDSPFAALCPLCALKREMAEVQAKADEWERLYLEAPCQEEYDEQYDRAETLEQRCNENEAAISAIVYSEGAERDKAIAEAAKLID